MKLFGYKRWYEEKVDGKNFKRKIKIKKENSAIRQDEKNLSNNIDDIEFINELITYKTRGNKLGNKFNDKNILFKINKNFEINCIELIQSKVLGAKNKELADKNNANKNIYSKNNYSKILNKEEKKLSDKQYLKIFDSGKYIFPPEKVEGEFVIKLYTDIERFKNATEEKAIFYKKLSEAEVKIKKDIYQICEKINEELFEKMKEISKTTIETRKIREEFLLKIKNLEKIIENFSSLQKKIKEYNEMTEKQEKDIMCFLNKLFNLNKKKTSDNKKIFVKKIMGFLKDEIKKITDNDIKEFLVDEGIHFDILKRKERRNKLFVDKNKKINICSKENEKIKNNLINTYIKKDNHTRYIKTPEKMKEKIQNIIDIYNSRQNEIENILKAYNMEKLKEIVKQEIEESKKIDTNLFGKLKEHYKEICKKKKEIFIKEKELSKIIYRYIKGRIEKIINVVTLEDYKKKLDEILDFEKVKEKVLKRIEQYIIENLIYLGKIRILGLEEKKENEIRKSFIEYQAEEELELEFLNFVSATNLKLNELFKNQKNERAVFDYFANIKEKVDNHFKSLDVVKSGTILRNRLNIDIENFKTYLELMTSVRSKIVHRGNSPKDNISLFDYYKTSKKISPKLEKDYDNVIKKINELKISDEEICKNLNLDILFNNKNMKSIIAKINKIDSGNTKTIYFPNYSKLVPKIENELREAVSMKNFNDMEFSILKNAFIYLNKVLYYKTISNWEEEKEEEYKNAQIKASKGDKKAIKKFQNKFIDEYLEKIKIEYKALFNFDYLKNIEVGISEANGERKLDKNCILNSESKDIKIKNDFEYIIIVSALIMNDNTYINKFRNRLFSTFTALESMDSNIENLKNIQNLIEILDIIITINKEKRDYRNEQLLNSNDRIEKIKKEIENLKIQNITLTKQDYIHIIECCKDKLFLKSTLLQNIEKIYDKEKNLLVDLFREPPNKISEYFNKNSIPKEYISAVIAFNKEIPNIKEKIASNKLHTLLSTSSQKNVDDLLRKEQLLLDKEKLVLELESSKEILNKYIEQMEEITKNDKEDKRNFEELYYQKNNALIYKKNLFYYINQDSFQEIYDKFLKEDLENISTSILKNNTEIVKKINDVNKILTDINNYTHGFSKEYKENFVKNIENFLKKRKYNGIETFEDFKEIYSKVKEYKHNKEVIEMATIRKLINYLIEINWKLAIQISRIERDIDYLYNGIITMDSKLKIENKDAKLRLNKVLEYCKNKQNNDIFKSLEELRDDLEIEKKENENSTRNVVAHFELLQTPFKNVSLIEIINKVSKLSEYRTRYNNSVYNSCFEVLKRDFDLNYENLKKKFKLSCSSRKATKGEFKIKDILSPKKVSILNLEENNELLAKVENFFEYKI